jgi:hypothetical protein
VFILSFDGETYSEIEDKASEDASLFSCNASDSLLDLNLAEGILDDPCLHVLLEHISF